MSKFMKMFKRKKEEAAFKMKADRGMGQGHTLNEPTPQPGSSRSGRNRNQDVYVPLKRNELSTEAKAAANAALARIQKMETKEFNVSLAAIKARARRELEAERRQQSEEQAQAMQQKESNPSVSQEQSVVYRCPIVSDEVLTKLEWRKRIKEFLYEHLESDRGLTACLIIRNCNTKEKANDCIDTLCKYIDNLIQHPEEEKFCKIRMSNRIFCEKVRYVEGAMDFLIAAGFREVKLDEEDYLIWSADNIEAGHDLPEFLDGLKDCEVINLELDRNIQVLLPSQAKHFDLAQDFYHMTPEELKREEQLRSEALEKSQVLRTKAMRERDEQRALRIYRYCIIRIKFPNGIYIQGTFDVHEKVSDVYEFVQSCLSDETLNFDLFQITFPVYTEEDLSKTLLELRLIPYATLHFKTSVGNSTGSLSNVNFLKENLLLLVQPL